MFLFTDILERVCVSTFLNEKTKKIENGCHYYLFFMYIVFKSEKEGNFFSKSSYW